MNSVDLRGGSVWRGGRLADGINRMAKGVGGVWGVDIATTTLNRPLGRFSEKTVIKYGVFLFKSLILIASCEPLGGRESFRHKMLNPVSEIFPIYYFFLLCTIEKNPYSPNKV